MPEPISARHEQGSDEAVPRPRDMFRNKQRTKKTTMPSVPLATLTCSSLGVLLVFYPSKSSLYSGPGCEMRSDQAGRSPDAADYCTACTFHS
jgi:hypothetical protein